MMKKKASSGKAKWWDIVKEARSLYVKKDNLKKVEDRTCKICSRVFFEKNKLKLDMLQYTLHPQKIATNLLAQYARSALWQNTEGMSTSGTPT